METGSLEKIFLLAKFSMKNFLKENTYTAHIVVQRK